LGQLGEIEGAVVGKGALDDGGADGVFAIGR
jgi:hypothetical protein